MKAAAKRDCRRSAVKRLARTPSQTCPLPHTPSPQPRGDSGDSLSALGFKEQLTRWHTLCTAPRLSETSHEELRELTSTLSDAIETSRDTAYLDALAAQLEREALNEP